MRPQHQGVFTFSHLSAGDAKLRRKIVFLLARYFSYEVLIGEMGKKGN